VAAKATSAIASNGFGDGPAQALRDYLLARGESLVTILHPLTPEEGTRHVVTTYVDGACIDERIRRSPLRPPASYALDPLIPLLPPRVDAWFGFNPLACGRGLVARKLGRAERVVLWSVDFVPDRFGAGTIATSLYDRLDRHCCQAVDLHVELTETARAARLRRHGLGAASTPAHVVPMGAWLDRVVTTTPDGYSRRRVVYLGHLVSRQGVEMLLDALAVLRGRDEEITADVIGTGPLEAHLRDRAVRLGLGDVVRFHGFVADHRDVERMLAEASIAVAPYRSGDDTFTRYADPGKLKAYLAAGLPILLTDVPPNAHELAREAGAEIVDYDASAIAEAISRGLDSVDAWQQRRSAALAYVRQFDWPVLLAPVLDRLALDSHRPPGDEGSSSPRTKPSR